MGIGSSKDLQKAIIVLFSKIFEARYGRNKKRKKSNNRAGMWFNRS